MRRNRISGCMTELRMHGEECNIYLTYCKADATIKEEIRNHQDCVTGNGTGGVKDNCFSHKKKPGEAGSVGGKSGMKNLRLKAARAAKDLSQQALAEKVGVSRQTINAIEKGDYNPTIRLCIAICRELDKTLDEIFWEEEEC